MPEGMIIRDHKHIRFDAQISCAGSEGVKVE